MIIIAVLCLCAVLSSLISLSQIRFLRGARANLGAFLADFSSQIPAENAQSVNFAAQNPNKIAQNAENSQRVNFQAQQNTENSHPKTNENSQSANFKTQNPSEISQNAKNSRLETNQTIPSLKKSPKNPSQAAQTLENSRFYQSQAQAIEIAIENEKFSIYSRLYELVLYALWIAFGFAWLKGCVIGESATLANAAGTAFANAATAVNAVPSTASAGSTLENTLFVLAFLVINTALSLPLSIYNAFVKDRKHGFSTITPALFVKDTLTNLALLAVLGFALIYALVLCYEFLGTWWWLAAFGVAFGGTLLANAIYPTLIVPLFNKLEPLQDGALSEQIAALLRRCGLCSKGVFVIDASKRDKRLNAYFAGLFKARRVVLFDTLLRAFGERQLLAVLGHELGHFVHKDLLKALFCGALTLFLLFFIIAHLPSILYEQIHLDGVNVGVFVLLIILGDVFGLIFSPLVNFLSRKNEFAADLHGAQMTSPQDMSSALLVLAMENKAFVASSRLYECFNSSHPSIAERVKALQQAF